LSTRIIGWSEPDWADEATVTVGFS
jgi:hypothetical protein